MIKSKKPDVDDFIKGAKTEQAEPQKKEKKELARYLLRLPEELRRELRHEAIEKKMNMSEYICSILERREELLK